MLGWMLVIWMVAVLYYLQKISRRLYVLAFASDVANNSLRRIEDALNLTQKRAEPEDEPDQP